MSDKIKINGIAIVEGTSRNGIHYSAHELMKFAPTLTNRPILKDHEGLTDNTIGLVTLGESLHGGQKVRYEGWIKEDGSGIVEKIRDGRIKEVSIGAIAEQLVREKDSKVLIAKGLQAMELSTTPTPGVVGTSLEAESIQLSKENINDWIDEYFKDEQSDLIENNQKEVNMESKDTKVIESVSNTSDAELRELKAKLETLEKENADLLEARRQDAISAYKSACEKKGLTAKDASKLTMETIKALTEMADDLPEPEEEEEEEEVVTEEDAPEEEEKPEAEPKSEEVESEDEDTDELFDNYVVESSELGGFAFYRK